MQHFLLREALVVIPSVQQCRRFFEASSKETTYSSELQKQKHGRRAENSVVDMVCFFWGGALYLPPPWKVFLDASKVFQSIFFQCWGLYLPLPWKFFWMPAKFSNLFSFSVGGVLFCFPQKRLLNHQIQTPHLHKLKEAFTTGPGRPGLAS